MVAADVPEPVPGEGQVLVRTLACGICGSDLHFVHHGRRMIELSRESGMPGDLDVDRDVYMGHEFCAEVLELGPGATGPAPGTPVVSIPALFAGPPTPENLKILAYSNELPAGYCERFLLSSFMALPVPNGLDPRHAALTEPMAVGVHAVNRSGIKAGDAALVLGCGPVGLACIAALRLKGIEPIVATDLSQRRRELALVMGAHEVVDPREEPGIEAWQRVDGQKPLVLFEAVGVPGMLDAAMRDAPRGARILVVGVCMEADEVQPIFGINKELEVRFALGYDPFEFADTLRLIAEGELEVAPLITGSVDIDGVPAAFDSLASPDEHCKILVEPSG